MEKKLKLYQGVLWFKGSDKPGIRVELLAKDAGEAMEKLYEKYGVDITFSVRNEEDAQRLR